MRIIAGSWRGRPLKSPPGQTTRPTSDRAREGLFSMLASRIGTFEGLHVADLFCGTGALGLEALSRGAAFCTFVDRDRSAIDVLGDNVNRLDAQDRCAVLCQTLEHARPPSRPCDVVFMDPPYDQGLAEIGLALVARNEWVARGGWLTLELGREQPALPAGFSLDTERRFGKARLQLIRRA